MTRARVLGSLALIALIGVVAAVLTSGADSAGDAERPGSVSVLSRLTLQANGDLPPQLEELLSGNAATCRSDKECAGAVCYYGRCLGLLQVDQRWSQERVLEQLKELLAKQGSDALMTRLTERLAGFIGREDADVAWRARAILGLEAIDQREPLAEVVASHPDDRVKAAAALALTRMGDPRGLPLTTALTESEQTHVAIEAVAALGLSKQPKEALRPLLANLSDDLDRMLVRATVEALGVLGDRRAVRPLVGFLSSGPDHLAHRIAGVLRRLTRAEIGLSVDEWTRWIAENTPPQPPEVVVRTSDAEADFGVPEF